MANQKSSQSRRGSKSGDKEESSKKLPLWAIISSAAGLILLLGVVVYFLLPEGPVKVDVFPVNGLVKINGKPAYGVHVYYWPIGTPEREFAFRHGIGITDKDGKYSIRCAAGAGDGLGPGKYKVTFEQYVDKNGKPITTLDKAEGSIIRTRIPRPHSDHDYPENSPHSADIVDGKNEHEFDLNIDTKS
jgi:hypothetical protein